MPQLLTPKQAAKIARVDPLTLRQQADSGQLAVEFTPGGHRRYRLSDLQRHYPQSGHTLSAQLLFVAPEEELREIFNQHDLINPPSGSELADKLQREIDQQAGNLWDWIVANNFQFDLLVFVDRPKQALWIGEDPGLSNTGRPAIKISAEVPITPELLAGEPFADWLEDRLYGDWDGDEQIEFFRRAGLFASCQVSFYQPPTSELRALRQAYYG